MDKNIILDLSQPKPSRTPINSYKAFVNRCKVELKCKYCERYLIPKMHRKHLESEHSGLMITSVAKRVYECFWCLYHTFQGEGKAELTPTTVVHLRDCLARRIEFEKIRLRHFNPVQCGDCERWCRRVKRGDLLDPIWFESEIKIVDVFHLPHIYQVQCAPGDYDASLRIPRVLMDIFAAKIPTMRWFHVAVGNNNYSQFIDIANTPGINVINCFSTCTQKCEYFFHLDYVHHHFIICTVQDFFWIDRLLLSEFQDITKTMGFIMTPKNKRVSAFTAPCFNKLLTHEFHFNYKP